MINQRTHGCVSADQATAARRPSWLRVPLIAVLAAALSIFGMGSAFAAVGVDWSSQTPSAANAWTGIAYGGGTYVAVSNTAGTGNQVMTSTDGATWTARTSAADSGWSAITYGNGLFVAVAGSGTNRVMTSPDGTTWTARTAAEANTWRSVTYGNGLFVAVSSDGTNRVMTSPDGATWTARTAAAANTWRSVTYGLGLFVAVSSDGTNRVMTSTNGVTWTARTAAAANSWTSITYGNGLLVAVSSDGTNRVMTSPDGTTWTARTQAASNSWTAVTYSYGAFAAVSSDGSNTQAMYSPDGVTWTQGVTTFAATWTAVAGSGGTFVAVANGGTGPRVMTNGSGTVGTKWTGKSASSALPWRSVVYDGSKFVAVAKTTGTASVMSSTDGNTWTAGTIVSGLWNSIAFGNTKYVAVGDGGVNLYNTGTGTSGWTSGTTITGSPNPNLGRVAYGNGLFVAGAEAGSNIYTSPGNGIWTARTLPTAGAYRAIAYGNSRWVAISILGAMATSTDGSTWTNTGMSGIAANDQVLSLVYGNGQFVAVGNQATYTSSDGLTWVERVDPGPASPTAQAWRDVTYANGMYVAVSSNIATYRVMTSPDGINWSLRKAAADSSWFSVAYGGGAFVAVADSGTGSRVMRSDATPSAFTGAATSVTTTSATLTSIVNANGFNTTDLTIKYSTTQADVDGGGGTSPAVTPVRVTGSAGTAVTVNLTGLTANTTYYYRVSASNSLGTANGTTRSFSTAPAAPTISGTVPGPSEARVTFTAPASNDTILSYDYSTDDGASWTSLPTGTTTSPLTISDMANEAAANVKLRAVTFRGSGAASTASAVTPTRYAPRPTGLSVSGGVLTWNSSQPNWTATIASYTVAYRKPGTVPWAVYAKGRLGTSITLNNTLAGCSATNSAAGWVSCPMKLGQVSGQTYELAVFAVPADSALPNPLNNAVPLAAGTSFTG